MISAAKSLARAKEWMARADRAPVGRCKDRLERIARGWSALAITAEADEAAARRRGLPRA